MKKLIPLLSLALIFCACHKEPTPTPDPETTTPLMQSATTHRVLYDAQGNALPDQEWTETQQWEYDAQGRVARITTDYTNYLGTEHSVQRNTYAADGRLSQAVINDGQVSATFLYPTGYERTLIDIAYNGEDNYSITIDHPGGRPTAIEERGVGDLWRYTTELQDDGQNILRATCTQVGGGATYVRDFQYQYDSHPSPTRGQFNLKEFSYQEFPVYYSHNNPVSELRAVSVEGQSDQLTYTYTYTYNAAGYPLTRTAEATTSSGRRDVKTTTWTYQE